MKTIYVQKQVIGWEEYKYEVPDDFEDYKSLEKNIDWVDYEFLVDSAEETGLVEIYDSDYNEIEY
jgi:hypothetical protein